MSDPLNRLPKSEVIRLLNESRAREIDLKTRFCGLEEDYLRKTSDLDLSQRREYELRKAQSNTINERTRALGELEAMTQVKIRLQKEVDAEKAFRAELQQHIFDLRAMVHVMNKVADRE